jgi:catechol 2,3-dioxygenase-like lactoylglutathione lyase family enzyme|tara:strand:- start:2 stop:388 length:387 start_codon:yes stop_codon:yes gene_type:complete
MNNIFFDHVHIISQNPEESAKWFEEILGGKKVETVEIQGAPQIYVLFEGAKVIIRGQRNRETAHDKNQVEWGTDHFAFQVKSNFHEYCEDLKSKGVKFTLEPTQFNPSTLIAFIEAPDGVSIELLQRK